MNTQKPLKNKVSVSLDENIIRRIHELAEADDRNFSQYINMVLKKHIQSTETISIDATSTDILTLRKTSQVR